MIYGIFIPPPEKRFKSTFLFKLVLNKILGRQVYLLTLRPPGVDAS